jgi:hypothetical protein
VSDLALRQRSSTELVDATFQLYRKDPLPFLLAGAVVYVPWLLIRLVFGFGLGSDTASVGETFASAIGILIVYAFASAATSVLTRDVYFNRPADFASALKATLPKLGSIFVATVVAGVIYFISILLLVFPFFFAITRLFALRQAIMLEDKSVSAAFSRTSQLARGVMGHIFLTLFLVALLTLAINIGAGMLALMMPSLILQNVFTTVVTTVIFPLFAITETLLYYDVRIRKEGFDVEYLATGDPGAAPATLASQ